MHRRLLLSCVYFGFLTKLCADDIIYAQKAYQLSQRLGLYQGKKVPALSTHAEANSIFIVQKVVIRDSKSWFILKSKKTGKEYLAKESEFRKSVLSKGKTNPNPPKPEPEPNPSPISNDNPIPVPPVNIYPGDFKNAHLYFDTNKSAHSSLLKALEALEKLDPYSINSFDTNNSTQAKDFLSSAKDYLLNMRALAFNTPLSDDERNDILEKIKLFQQKSGARVKAHKGKASDEDFKKWFEYQSLVQDLKYAVQDNKKHYVNFNQATETGYRLLTLVRSSSFFPTSMKLFQLAKISPELKIKKDFFDSYKHFNAHTTPSLVEKELEQLEKYPKLLQKFYASFRSSKFNADAYDLNAHEDRAYFVTNTIKPDNLSFAKLEGVDKTTGKHIIKVSPATPESKEQLRKVIDKSTLNLKGYESINSQLYYKVVFGNQGPEFLIPEDEFRRLTTQDALWNAGPYTLIDDANPNKSLWNSFLNTFQEPPTEGQTYHLARKPVKQTKLTLNEELKAIGYSTKGFVFESLNDKTKYVFPEDTWHEFLKEKKQSKGFLPEWLLGHNSDDLYNDIDPNLLEIFNDPEAGFIIAKEIEDFEARTRTKHPRFKKIFNPLAQFIFQRTGFPPDVFLGQVGEESGWGISPVLQKTNNTAGVSCTKEGNVRTETISFLTPPLIVSATCSVSRPGSEGGFYYKFKNLYEAVMFQVWNLLYNPGTATTYKKAREAAENIRKATDKNAAVEKYTDLFISGMAGWAKNSEYTDVLEERRRKMQNTIEGSPKEKSKETK